MKGIGTNMNQYLKNIQLDEFIITVKEYFKKVKTGDSEVEAEILQSIKKIYFLQIYYTKF